MTSHIADNILRILIKQSYSGAPPSKMLWTPASVIVPALKELLQDGFIARADDGMNDTASDGYYMDGIYTVSDSGIDYLKNTVRV